MLLRKRDWIIGILLALCLGQTVAAAECEHEFVRHTMEPTCIAPGLTYEECTLCGLQLHYETIDPPGHEFGEWYVLQEPTCSKEGIQARDCVVCGYQDQSTIDHLGHEYVVQVVAPTCTARGYTQHYCAGCGDRFRTDYVAPTGHSYVGAVTKEPTLTAMGRITYTCTGCGDTYQETIPKLTNPFEDISEDAYYFMPVLWAVNNGITTGMDETHFAPDRSCTRAQVVTFLWRAAGKPQPEGDASPFEDVPADVYYRDAVLWAYQTGITTGVDAAHFGPDNTCTRAQVVTFLYRANGSPAYASAAGFQDVLPTDYFYDAVCWAAGNGITTGMDGGRFCPHQTCTRAQVVTFLYRAR